jgi:hypothetical protein
MVVSFNSSIDAVLFLVSVRFLASSAEIGNSKIPQFLWMENH